MSTDKFLHYYPGVEFNWPREDDWASLDWRGLGDKPDEAAFAAMPWPPVPSLDELKLAKWELVKARRDACIDAGTEVEGVGPFDSNLTSRININGAVTMATIALANAVPFEISWTLADNSVQVLDGPTMIAAGVAIGQHVSACHAAAQDLRSQIEAASDQAALDAIDSDAGWPT